MRNTGHAASKFEMEPEATVEQSEEGARMLDAFITFGIRVASAGLVLLLQVFLARVMPLKEYGSYVTMWTWLVMLAAFVPLGFSGSAVRFIPRYHSRGRYNTARAFWRLGLQVTIIMSIFIFGIAVILAIAHGATATKLGTSALIIACALPFLGVQTYLEGVARAFGWFKMTSIPIYIFQPTLILISGVIITIQTGQLSLLAIGIVIVVVTALISTGLVIALSLAMHRKFQNALPYTRTGTRRAWLKASLPLMLVSGIEDLMIYIDVLLLGMLMEPEQVSVYFVTTRALSLANFVYYAFFFISARGFSIANATADREKLQQAVWSSSRATFWFTVLAVLATLAIGPWLLEAFGSEFTKGYFIMWILGAGYVARGLAGQAAELLVTTGKQNHIIAAGATSIGCNIILTVILIPQIGIAGAAISTAIAMLVRTIMLCVSVHRISQLSVISLGFPALRLSTLL